MVTCSDQLHSYSNNSTEVHAMVFGYMHAPQSVKCSEELLGDTLSSYTLSEATASKYTLLSCC